MSLLGSGLVRLELLNLVMKSRVLPAQIIEERFVAFIICAT